MDAGILYCLEGAKEIHRYSLFSHNALVSSAFFFSDLRGGYSSEPGETCERDEV